MPLLDQSLVDSVIKRALRSGADFVELFVERKRNQSISVEESKVQRVNSGNDLGAGLRIIHQGTVSYIYTEDLSEGGLLKTADLAAEIGRRGGGRFSFGELSGVPRQLQRIDVPPDTVGPEAKIELLLEADQAARAVSGAVKQVAVGYGQSAQEVLVATSEGIHHEDSRTRIRLMVHAVAERNVSRALELIPHVLAQPKTTGVSIVMSLTTQMLAISWGRAKLDEGLSRARLSQEYFDLLRETGAYTGRPWGSATAIWARSAERWSREALDHALDALLEADIALKESRVSSDEQLLATVILSLCAADEKSAAA